jgi:hypothetical protein
LIPSRVCANDLEKFREGRRVVPHLRHRLLLPLAFLSCAVL